MNSCVSYFRFHINGIICYLLFSELLLNGNEVYLANIYSVPDAVQSAWLILSLMYTRPKGRSQSPTPIIETEVQGNQISCS